MTFLPSFHPKKIFLKKNFRHSFTSIFADFFEPSLIMIGQVNSILLIFCCFCSNMSFLIKKYSFWLFWANCFLIQKHFFSIISHYFFWFFKLSTISLGQLSSILSIFCDFLLQKSRFCQVFHPKKFFSKKFFWASCSTNYYKNFELSTIFLRQLSSSGSLLLTFPCIYHLHFHYRLYSLVPRLKTA